MNMEGDDLVRMSRVLRHRLRNYASGIKISAMLLSQELKDRLTPSEREYFPLIARECDQLAELTNRLSLLFEELPAPKESLMATVIEQVMTRAHNLAPTAKIRLELTPEASTSRVASGERLAICLEEVLTNAREAAPAGEIALHIAREPDRLVLRVEDEGPGVKTLALDNLFKPFYTTKSRHVGLGLAIVRRLTEALGGTTRVAARPSEGLTVEVELPIQGG